MSSPPTAAASSFFPYPTATFPPPADPFTQPITILLPDGTPFNVTMDQFAFFHTIGVQVAISQGVALGASAILLIVLLFLTRADKRRSPIFLLNLAALLLNVIRKLLGEIYLAGPFQNPYAVISGDFSQISGIDMSNSVAVPVLTLLMLGVVECSLLLQVKVVLATVRARYRYPMLAVLGCMALVTVGFEFAVMVINSRDIISLEDGFDPAFQALLVESSAVTMVSFTLFMLVFVGKMGYAIRQRRMLGIKQFGPMQILFIMMLQTMIIPTVTSILVYCTNIPEMSTWFLTLVALSLPLSSLWAAHNVEETQRTAASSQKRIATASYGSGGSAADRKRSIPTSTMSDGSGMLLNTPTTVTAPRSPFEMEKLDEDVEMGRIGSVDVPMM